MLTSSSSFRALFSAFCFIIVALFLCLLQQQHSAAFVSAQSAATCNPGATWQSPYFGKIIKGALYYNHSYLFVTDSDKLVRVNAASPYDTIWQFTSPTGNCRTKPSVYVSSDNKTALIFFTSEDKKLYAVHAGNGTMAWSYTTGTWLAYSDPFFYDEPTLGPIVLVGGYDSNLYAIKALSGALAWSWSGGGGTNYIKSSPYAYNKRVYFGNDAGLVTCLNTATGAKVWQKAARGSGTKVEGGALVMPSLGLLAIGTSFDMLIYRLSDAAFMYGFSTSSKAVKATPSFDAATNMLFWPSDNGCLYKAELFTSKPGVVKWSSCTNGPSPYSTPYLMQEQTVWVGGLTKNSMYVMSMATGAMIKQVTGPTSWVQTTLAVATDECTAGFGSNDGRFYILNLRGTGCLSSCTTAKNSKTGTRTFSKKMAKEEGSQTRTQPQVQRTQTKMIAPTVSSSSAAAASTTTTMTTMMTTTTAPKPPATPSPAPGSTSTAAPSAPSKTSEHTKTAERERSKTPLPPKPQPSSSTTTTTSTTAPQTPPPAPITSTSTTTAPPSPPVRSKTAQRERSETATWERSQTPLPPKPQPSSTTATGAGASTTTTSTPAPQTPPPAPITSSTTTAPSSTAAPPSPPARSKTSEHSETVERERSQTPLPPKPQPSSSTGAAPSVTSPFSSSSATAPSSSSSAEAASSSTSAAAVVSSSSTTTETTKATDAPPSFTTAAPVSSTAAQTPPTTSSTTPAPPTTAPSKPAVEFNMIAATASSSPANASTLVAGLAQLLNIAPSLLKVVADSGGKIMIEFDMNATEADAMKRKTLELPQRKLLTLGAAAVANANEPVAADDKKPFPVLKVALGAVGGVVLLAVVVGLLVWLKGRGDTLDGVATNADVQYYDQQQFVAQVGEPDDLDLELQRAGGGSNAFGGMGYNDYEGL